ncbi:MAG: STAS domain-containing protein [bacterium]|nr:STAS domain-containing protein [bacterium]
MAFLLFWFPESPEDYKLSEMGGELELAIEQSTISGSPSHFILRLSGYATPANHAILTKAFQKVQDDLAQIPEPGGGVILDFKRLESVGSSCVGAMLSMSRNLQKAERRVVLAEVSPAILQILDMLQLRDLFPDFETEAQAHAALKTAI